MACAFHPVHHQRANHGTRAQVDTNRAFLALELDSNGKLSDFDEYCDLAEEKFMEVLGAGCTPPRVGDIVDLQCGIGRVSHVGGFAGIPQLRRFFEIYSHLTCCSAAQLLALKGCGEAEMGSGQGFWFSLEFYNFTLDRSK